MCIVYILGKKTHSNADCKSLCQGSNPGPLDLQSDVLRGLPKWANYKIPYIYRRCQCGSEQTSADPTWLLSVWLHQIFRRCCRYASICHSPEIQCMPYSPNTHSTQPHRTKSKFASLPSFLWSCGPLYKFRFVLPAINLKFSVYLNREHIYILHSYLDFLWSCHAALFKIHVSVYGVMTLFTIFHFPWFFFRCASSYKETK